MNMPKGLRRTAARFCPLLAAAASLLALVSSANAATITTTVVSDAYALDLNNDGITETACCPTDGFIRVFGTVKSKRGVWEFSLADIPQTATINSASVTFRAGGTVHSTTMELFAYAGDGIAAGADGNNISVLAGGFALIGVANYSPILNTAVIQNLVSSGTPYLGLVMKRTLENASVGGGDFCALEATGISFYDTWCGGFPGSQLTIDYTVAADPSAVPIPPAFALFASGIAAIVLLARRRKKHA